VPSPVAFDFVDFYRLALAWNDVDASEAVIRCVTSRAYYSAFISARIKANLQISQASHIATQNHYKALPGVANRLVFNNLNALHELRKRADYESPAFEAKLANRAVNMSKDILKALGRAP
jgi:uncharacterized protein (UPF0332 family)